MKHATAKGAWTWGLLVALALGTPGIGAQTSNGDAITITPADFKISKQDALERLADLEAMAAISVSTADYAEAFREFQDDLPDMKPPVSEWSESEQERVENIKQPTDAAWQALQAEQQRTRDRQEQRKEAAQEDWAMRQRHALEQERLQAERARTAQQLRLQEAQISESEARADYYDELSDDSWNSWYSPWWFHRHPGSVINKKRVHIHEPIEPWKRRVIRNTAPLRNMDGRLRR